jgi:hypothetical protein
MDKREANALIRRAEEEIAQILKRLEQETNQYVNEVDLRKENMATHLDQAPLYVRHVALIMCHPPGSNWR